jgi:hypothetical protein
LGDQGDVSSDEPATDGLAQSSPDDQMDLIHGLRSERGVSIPGMEQLVVEGLEGTVEDGAAALSLAVAAAKEHAGFPTLEIQAGKTGLPRLAFVGPLGGKVRVVKLDLAVGEYVEAVEEGTMQLGLWGDLPDAVPFDVYPVEEITAEKLRCIIQRVQCRDLYDLVRLTEDLKVDLSEVRGLFEGKARIKGLDPAAFGEKFGDRVDRYKERWDREMREHLADPPQLEDVVRIVSRRLRAAAFI